MRLYHYSNSFQEKLVDLSDNKSGIVLTTSAKGHRGDNWLFCYEVEYDVSQLKAINADLDNVRDYICTKDELVYNNYKCLDTNFEPVVQAAIIIRKLLDEAKNTFLKDDNQFQRFPDGCCSDTAVLLKQFIQDRFEGKYNQEIKYRNGNVHREDIKRNGLKIPKGLNKEQSHAWIEYRDEVIIDITANQFSEKIKSPELIRKIKEPVVITKDREFYKLFTTMGTQIDLDINTIFKPNKERLLKIYDLICKSI